MTDKITIAMRTVECGLLHAAIDALEGTDLGHYYATLDALRAALAAQPAEPMAWKHDCAGLCTNDVELWIDACPHCGKPRNAHPPAAQPVEPVACPHGCTTQEEHDAHYAAPAAVPLIDDMDKVAIRYAHKMALDLECILAEYGGSWYNTAMQTLGEYRSAMNAIHERESPTFMGEPVIAAAAGDKP